MTNPTPDLISFSHITPSGTATPIDLATPITLDPATSPYRPARPFPASLGGPGVSGTFTVSYDTSPEFATTLRVWAILAGFEAPRAWLPGKGLVAWLGDDVRRVRPPKKEASDR